jgi:hypothetical protein
VHILHHFYGAENRTLRAVDQKYVRSFGTWFWERLKKISWTDRVRNGDVVQRTKERSSILHTAKRRKLTGFVRCCVETVFKTSYCTEDRRVEVMGRRGRRRKHLLEVLKEKKGYRKLKEEAPDRTLRRTGCGWLWVAVGGFGWLWVAVGGCGGCGPVLRQTAE